MSRLIRLSNIVPLICATAATAATSADIEYEKTAYRLELVRNQIELTIANHVSVHEDLHRQDRELAGMSVFEKIPLASAEPRNDRALGASLRKQFEKAAQSMSGFKPKTLLFASPWSRPRGKIPAVIGFDENYLIPEDQLVESRQVKLEFIFDSKPPAEPANWFAGLHAARFMSPQKWNVRGKKLAGTVLIYHYRDVAFPKLAAPDLSRYRTAQRPVGPTQTAAAKRIAKYLAEIPGLWPKAQPFLDDLRTFALNDQRINFFLGHVKIQE